MGLMSVNIDRKTEIGGQVITYFSPKIAGVITAHYVPVFLHEENVRPRAMHGDAMDTVTDLGIGIG